MTPTLAATLLLALRWFVLLRLQPHWALAVGRLWWPISAGLAGALAVAAQPGAVAGIDVGGLARAAGAEVLLGAAQGVLISLPAYALLGASTASGAVLRASGAPFVRLCVAAALAAALVSQMHHPVLVVLRDQADILPPGRAAAWLPQFGSLAATATVQLDAMLVLALTLATPVLLSTLVLRLSIAAVGAGPSGARPVAEIAGPAVGTLGALLAFAASWAVYPAAWAHAAIP